MKKTLVSIATLALCSAACAQSSVTLFGIIDTAVGYNNSRGNTKVWRLDNSGLQISRIGFRGVEDLGGGLSASFWLEGQLGTDDGRAGGSIAAGNQAATVATNSGFNFNRRSTVSLAGPLGEVRLGRDYNPGIWNIVLYDPFSNTGVGASQSFNSIITGSTAVRASNMVGYFTPPKALGGFFVNVAHWYGENTTSTTTVGKKDGTGSGVRAGYADGPFEASIAISRTQYLAGDVHQDNVGGSWDFGVAKVMGSYSRDKNAAINGRGGELAAIIPVGVGDIRVQYSQYKIERPTGEPTAKKISLGYVHNLSKRTSAYVIYGRVNNSNGSTAPATAGAPAPGTNMSSDGFSIGVRHVF